MSGCVGVGGWAPKPPVWSDEICGQKGLTEVFGPSVPPLVEDLPPRENPNSGKTPVPRFATATPPKSTLASEYVVSGKRAATAFDGNQISLTAAKQIATRSPDLAASQCGCAVIYILDNP